MSKSSITVRPVEQSIRVVRGQRIMLDADLARLYGVPTKRLNEAVKRNRQRFPRDFMFVLNAQETSALRSQIATSNGRGGRRYQPRAFTEQGIAMLSSVLNSARAIAVNIAIMRAFVKFRQAIAVNAELAKRLAVVEAKLDQHRAEVGRSLADTGRTLSEQDKHIRVVFETIRRLMVDDDARPATRIGFKLP